MASLGHNELSNILKPQQIGHRLPDEIFKCIFMNENMWILIKISLQFIPKAWINNILALGQIMASPARRQAIIWTNDGQGWWRIYASLSLNHVNLLTIFVVPVMIDHCRLTAQSRYLKQCFLSVNLILRYYLAFLSENIFYMNLICRYLKKNGFLK